MTVWQGWARVCFAGLFGLVMTAPAWAQSGSVTPEDEYKKLIRVSEDIQPLGKQPFGENINLYNGNLSFTQTDVDLPGNGPDLQLSRSFKIPDLEVTSYYLDFVTGVLGDWTLNVPRIETLSAADETLGGAWFFLDANQRCSHFHGAPSITVQQTPGSTPVEYPAYEWWHGYQMILPDGSSQDVLKRDSGNTQVPQMSLDGQPVSFPAVTKNHWAIGCLAQVANDPAGGEGFLAVSPDGTKYWFDHLAYRDAPPMIKAAGSALRRRVAELLVTRIEDRFGNYLTYEYDANDHLVSITANDGRELKLTYETWQTTGAIGGWRLKTLTLQPSSGAPRTWLYTYATAHNLPWLSHVQLPDDSSWEFDFTDATGTQSRTLLGSTDECLTVAAPTGNSYTLSVDHPSGLHGEFTVRNTVRGRSYVPFTCVSVGAVHHETRTPYAYVVAAITQRTLSGAGLSGQTWTYQYSQANESAIEDCGSGCTATVWTTVTDPGGSATRYIFSNKFDASESLLQQIDFYAGAVGSTRMRWEQDDYAAPSTGPWPSTYGSTLQLYMNSAQLEQLSPMNERVLTQAGDIYTWRAEAFNSYAQVTRTKRFNDIAGPITESAPCPSESTTCIEESTTYRNDTVLWVLGLPEITTNVTKGETISRNVYDTSDDTLQSRYRFGQKVMDYTFNSAGQLSSFTDGNGNMSTLGSYKRGIPRTINYPPTIDQPNGTSQSLSVDDFGQITAITDQGGHTTSYSYDAVGRLTQITYPSDSVAWYPKTFTYAYVAGAERGLAGRHWRRTTSTGNARRVTYFDALWRPVLSDTYIDGGSGPHSNVRIDYDWRGQTVFQSWPKDGTPSLGALANGTRTTYDALGRVTQVTQDSELGPLDTTTVYLSGAQKKVIDPNGNITITGYQVFDQPSYTAVTQVIAASGTPQAISQTITRDLYGHPISITQSGSYGTASVSATKRLFYDDHKRLCRTTEPESGSTVMDYDAANNLAWSASGLSITGDACGREQVLAGAKVNRSYDAMNRLKKITYPVGTDYTEFTYGERGDVQTAISGPTLWTYDRNARGLLIGETLDIDGYSWPIGYAYDRYGTVATVTYPDGKPVAYAPDALGRPGKAGTYATGVSYLPDGDIQHFTYLGGAEYLADKGYLTGGISRHLLYNLTVATDSDLVYSQDLVYDANANMTHSTDLTLGGTRTKILTYDALNRLIKAQADQLWGVETYTYDPLNNLRSLNSHTYSYDGHKRLDAILTGSTTLHSFTYDLRGNTIQKDGQTRTFDEANRLTAVGTTSYVYDAAGRRVKKADTGGQSTYYAYSGAGQLLWQYVPATPTTGTGSDYVYLGTKLVAKLDRDISTVPPAAPTSITVPATSDASLSVYWAASPYAVTYRLQQQKGAGAWTTVYHDEDVSTVLTLSASGTYVYRVAACNGSGCSAYTTSSPVAVTLPPAAAPALTVPGGTSTTGDYTVSWSALSDAATYVLQEQKNGGSWNPIYDGSSRSKVLAGRTNGTWGYRVQAHNTGGYGPWSVTKTVVVLLPPAQPTSIIVPATSSGSVATDWSSAATATSYKLQHRKGSGSWSQVYSGSATAKTVTETSTGSYTYRVHACNASGCGGWRTSSAVAVTIPPAGAPGLTVPTISSTGGYTVTWGNVSGAATYTLQEKKNSGSWSTVYSDSGHSKAFSGKTNGANYSYRVRAHNAGGDGPWSTTKAVHIAIPPPKPGNVHAIDDFPNPKRETLTIKWNAVSSASHYKVKQEDTGTEVYNDSGTSVLVESVTLPAIFAHTYAVSSCNAYACSAWVHVGLYTMGAPQYAPSLTAPSGSGSGNYTVSWGGVAGASSYKLQEKKNSGSWSPVYSGSGRSKAFSGKADASYGYRVQACNAEGCGPRSATRTVVVANVPAVPTGARVVEYLTARIDGYKAQWNAVGGASRYEAKRNDTGANVYSGTATTFIMDTAFIPQVPQYYRFSVRACNAAGCSGWAVGH